MPLLFDEDYEILAEAGLAVSEDESARMLVFENFPLPPGIYVGGQGEDLQTARILYMIPQNYNVGGGDMFWTDPALARADRQPIPAKGGGDTRIFNGVTFERWSRHWNHVSWRPKVDNIRTIIDRLTWALEHSNARRP
jgi:hypothetical protein